MGFCIACSFFTISKIIVVSSINSISQLRSLAVEQRNSIASAPVSNLASRLSPVRASCQGLCFLASLTAAFRNFRACLNAWRAAANWSSLGSGFWLPPGVPAAHWSFLRLEGWIHFVPGSVWFSQFGQNLASVASDVLHTVHLFALQTFHLCPLYQHLVHRITFLFLPPSSFSGVTMFTLLALMVPLGPFMTLYGSLSGPRKVK